MSSKLFGSDPLFGSNPLDARYTAHRDADDRRRQTREWLRQRERKLGFVLGAPPVVPEHQHGDNRVLGPGSAGATEMIASGAISSMRTIVQGAPDGAIPKGSPRSQPAPPEARRCRP
jgi:hypothetical protein